MRAKLIIEGKEFPIEIQDPELEKLLKPQKQTGYERLGEGHTYSYVDNYGEIRTVDHCDFDDDKRYEEGNYYSNYYVAENNARADKLMRQLRRFAAEHGEEKIDWNSCKQDKYFLYFDHEHQDTRIDFDDYYPVYGVIYFTSRNVANLAIETFHDELIWYFTEYKDSL